jgi:hypothetical protein
MKAAFVDGKGVYHPDPDQQPYAVQVEEGLAEPRDLGQVRHSGGRAGYCERHLVLGCMICRAAE